ncbi:MAG TPA: coproporphyrinogen-III oxidase family protein [Candidatus Ozemobacteraceae bacterium]|nr:coproporphyrinogen-III oxidase family protein [Candidatus Ozemobacteraceae bacterium]
MKDPAGLGLYLHVPFCLSKCGYCAFSSVVPSPGSIDAWLDRLAGEITRALPASVGQAVRTVFIGGGNPTAIGAKPLARVLALLQHPLEQAKIEEWTVETNPETLTPEAAAVLEELPGLRLSMGLQRLHDDELRLLDRRGTAAAGRAAITLALLLTPRVGVDLILGVPGCPSLAAELARLIGEFPVQHVSAYFLSVEEGTPLSDRVREGRFPDPSEVGPEELFEVADVLGQAGFEHYEISNFARPAGRCLHNMNYWLGGEYIGLGPAAVGTQNDVRRSNPASLRDWLDGRAPGIEQLSPEDRFRETVMLRLRLVSDGLDLSWLEYRYGPLPEAFHLAVDSRVSAGMLIRNGPVIRLSPKGIAFANRVISELF